MAGSARQLSYTRKIESDYIKRIEDILIPIVGEQGVRAQVSADIDFTMVESTTESYQPDSRVVRSEETFVARNREAVELSVVERVDFEELFLGLALLLVGGFGVGSRSGRGVESTRESQRNDQEKKSRDEGPDRPGPDTFRE